MSLRHPNRAAVNGRAAFCGTAFLTGIGLTLIAERVGAPEGVVRSLGGLLALPGLGLIGFLARSSRVAHFFAADRALPQTFGGLGLAGMAGGLGLCLAGDGAAFSPLPVAGVALGVGLGALAVGPALRRANATAPADFFALRFGRGLARGPMGLALLTIGALLAIAGYEAALDALVVGGIVSRPAGLVVIAAALALVVAPGGLAGVLWSAAACGGALLLALALPLAAQLSAPGEPLWNGWGAAGWLDGVSGAPPILVLATAVGIGALAPWTCAGVAARGPAPALRAGASGLFLTALMAAGALAYSGRFDVSPAESGIRAGALALAGIALASAGLFSATRAFAAIPAAGIDAPRALASQRLAWARGGALILVALCAGLLHGRPIDPSAAIVGAVVLSLTFVAPAFALAFSARAGTAQALACFLASLIALIALIWPNGVAYNAAAWLANGLQAAAFGVIAGWVANLFGGPRAATNRSRDAYFEMPDGPSS